MNHQYQYTEKTIVSGNFMDLIMNAPMNNAFDYV